jgi:long-subunit acyl-CoA synthetase (AMP-forming)
MYTSGTTGPPKGVRLTHRNIISQQKAISLLWDVDKDDTFLSYLPWHHSFGGLFERFMTLFNGATLGLDDSKGRDMERLVENWKLWEPTIFFSVPRVHEMLLSECKQNEEIDTMVFGERLRMVFTAGASLPATVEAGYRRHGIPVLEGWGLTETSPCVTVTTMDGTWRSGHVGMPIPGVRVKIDDSQEILVKGPNVMQGYLDDEDATARCIDRNGWFHTGDLGEFRKDGLRIFGRLDGAFKLTTGEKVHPQRIEITLANESEFISTALIVGSGQDYVGVILFPSQQNISAWLKENNLPLDSQLSCVPALRDLFARELERINAVIEVKYQRPVRAIIADNQLSLERGELTPSGKVVRVTVMGLYEDQIHDMFATNPSERVIRIAKHQMQGT